MTVDSGHLWVAEHIAGILSGMVNEFDANTDGFLGQLAQDPAVEHLEDGVAVGYATGEELEYVGGDAAGGSKAVVAVFNASGSFLTAWTGSDVTPSPSFGGSRSVGGVAVDNSQSAGDWASGDVYVAAWEKGVVDVFKPEAAGKETYLTQITGTSPASPFVSPVKVSVNPANGDVIVVDRLSQTHSVVDVFEPEAGAPQVYKFIFAISERTGRLLSGIRGVAVDGHNGDIYVAEDASADASSAAVIDQFDSAGTYLGQITGSPNRAFPEVTSIAIDQTDSDVFVGDRAKESPQEKSFIDKFGPTLVVPDVQTGSTSTLGATSVTLDGTVNPDGEGPATCQFVWGTTTALENKTACESTLPDGSSPTAVLASLEGLQPGTEYYYLLQAENHNGLDPGEAGEIKTFTTLGPTIAASWASNVAASSAELDASINPRATPTHYFFQYGTGDCVASPASCAVVPVSPESIGEGGQSVEVAQHLQHLEAGTTYDYRVVVVSEISSGHSEEFYGVEHSFTTQATLGTPVLPDGRAWELVSPPNKHNGSLLAIGQADIIQSSLAGDSVTYAATGPTEVEPRGSDNHVAEPKGSDNDVQVLSTRGVDGWESLDMSTAHTEKTGASTEAEYRFFSSELALGLVEPLGDGLAMKSEAFPQPTERTEFVRNNETCASTPETCYTPLLTSALGYSDVPPGTTFGGASNHIFSEVVFDGATADLKHVVLSSAVALTEEFPARSGALYEWSYESPASERVKIISVPPESEGGTSGVTANLGYQDVSARNAISADGQRVFWSATSALYMRDLGKSETIRLDRVQPGASGAGTVDPIFLGASSDGTRVYFTDTQQLTKGSDTTGADIYECEIAETAGHDTCVLSDLTPELMGNAADVKGILGIDEAGRSLYFVAAGALSADENGFGARAVAGEENLYLLHYDEDTSSWGPPRFIATLAGDDGGDWTPVLSHQTARVSPAGRYLAFMSSNRLTDYDNMDATSGKPDEEVYLYDSSDNRLVCASCNPTGARPLGVEYGSEMPLAGGFKVWPADSWIAANVPGWTSFGVSKARYQSRYLNDAGQVFFNSSDALVPQDINGTEDVYEYEPVGVGGCSREDPDFSSASAGCVSLISSGVSASESGFADASADGSNVFFFTSEKLVTEDYDSAVDVYDARVCSASSPCLAPEQEVAPCVDADSCRQAPLPQPAIFGAPPSATFSGTGNLEAKGSGAQSKTLTRSQKLARALRECKKKRKHGKEKRKRGKAACRKAAMRRYGSKKRSRRNHSGATERGQK